MSHKHHKDYSTWNRSDWELHFKSRGLAGEVPSFSGTLVGKLIQAGRFFNRNGVHDFSGLELAAVVHLNEIRRVTPKGIIASLYDSLSHYYSYYRGDMEFLQLPAIHLLRIETGNYRGNLHLCMGYEINVDGQLLKKVGDPVYHLSISKFDWQEGMRLPLPNEYDFLVGMLFGFYWGLGFVTSKKENSKHFGLSGEEKNRRLMKKIVKPLMESTHQMRVNERDQSGEGSDNPIHLKGREICLNGYGFGKNSMALVSFLENEHGFPSEYIRDRIPLVRTRKPCLPSIPWKRESIDGFVLAEILSRGNLYEIHRDTRPSPRFYISGEGGYGQEMSDLLKSFGYLNSLQPARNPDSWQLVFNKRETLHFMGLIRQYNLNMKHYDLNVLKYRHNSHIKTFK